MKSSFIHLTLLAVTTSIVPISNAQSRPRLPKEPLPPPENNNNNPPPPPVKPKTVFGTTSGYDVGGSDPLCWNSFFAASNETTTTSSDNDLDQLNTAFYQDENSQVELLPVCPTGTFMTLTPLEDDAVAAGKLVAVPEMLMDTVYTFRLVFEIDLETTESEPTIMVMNDSMPLSNYTIHARLHMCNALQQGFCNPLKDTRERDAALTKAESDLQLVHDEDSSSDDEEDLPQDKWKYTEGTVLRGLTDLDNASSDDPTTITSDSIYTRWIRWYMEPPDPVTAPRIYRAQVDLSILLPTATTPRGDYFLLGHVLVDLPNTDGDQQQQRRLDIAQTIPNKVVEVRPPPRILEVTKTTKWWLGTVIAISGVFCLYCGYFLLRNHQHTVMKLAQGNFLAAMTAACFLQTVSSFLFLPTHDVFCYLKGPLVKVPLTFVGAILLGRVWRVYTTLNAAHSMGKNHNKTGSALLERAFVRSLDILAGLGVCFGGRCCNCRDQSLSLTSTARPSLRRVVTAGETASLVVVLTLPQLVLQICGSIFIMDDGLDIDYTQDGNVGRIMCSADNQLVDWTGMAYAALVYALAVIMAWISRDLPSAFNEKDQIFHGASLGTILVVMSLALSHITDQPTTSPDVTVFLNACVSIGVAFFVLMLIVWPKVQRVRSGDKVVVRAMLGARFGSSGPPPATNTGISSLAISEVSQEPEQARPDKDEVGSVRKRLVVRTGDPVPPSIERKVFELQRLLSGVTNQCGDGRPLTKEEWQNMQGEVRRLEDELNLVDLQ